MKRLSCAVVVALAFAGSAEAAGPKWWEFWKSTAKRHNEYLSPKEASNLLVKYWAVGLGFAVVTCYLLGRTRSH